MKNKKLKKRIKKAAKNIQRANEAVRLLASNSGNIYRLRKKIIDKCYEEK